MQRIYQIRRPCKIRIAMVLVLSFFVYTCKIKEKQDKYICGENKMSRDYDDLKREVELLKQENIRLRNILFKHGINPDSAEEKMPVQNVRIKSSRQKEDHARQFFSYFCGRPDVFSLRYENRKTGKTGYFPQCEYKYNRRVCPLSDRSGTCATCKEKKYKAIDSKHIINHLEGSREDCSDVVGIYPLFSDNTCRLLVFDFDYTDSDLPVKGDMDWMGETDALRKICNDNNIPVLVERSRSGSGAHVWIFFTERISAELARSFGFALLEKGAESVNLKSFNFYDRMFPVQSKLPKGGIGNTIALPLQGQAVKKGNSVFVDENWKPYENQFEKLLSTKKLNEKEITDIMAKWKEEKQKLYPEMDIEKPWDYSPDFKQEEVNGDINVVLADYIYVDTTNLKPAMQNRIRRMAAVSNPEYFKKLAMNYSIYNVPRYIYEGYDEGHYIGIPGGLLEELRDRADDADININISDKRSRGRKLDLKFTGELRSEQETALKKIMQHERGIVSAATAFGKTVVSTALIAEKKTSTLIILESTALIEQWEKTLENFLDIDEEMPEYTTKSGQVRRRKSLIGKIHGTHDSSTGIIDIAMAGSLCKKTEFHNRLQDYGLIIVDECHHSAAATMSNVLKHVKAENVYGFTATPFRGDGLQKINEMLIGPVIFKYTSKDRARDQNIAHMVYPRFTKTVCPYTRNRLPINDAYELLRNNESRDDMITEDICKAVEEGRSPVVLTKYTDHAGKLYERLKDSADRVFLLTGKLSKKDREEVTKGLEELGKDQSMILIATGQLIGEGFDFPRLDTLFLTMPVSWKGLVEQYAGRLNRDYEHKENVIVYDYVDYHIPVFDKMYSNRMKSYKRIGYDIFTSERTEKQNANAIFDIDSYSEIYQRDLKEASSSIIISSPVIMMNKVVSMVSLLKEKQAAGVKVSVLTWHPDMYTFGNSDQRYETIEFLRDEGIYVNLVQERFCEHYAIIDSSIVWYGSVNLLGKEDIDDNIMRVESRSIAEELAEISFASDKTEEF